VSEGPYTVNATLRRHVSTAFHLGLDMRGPIADFAAPGRGRCGVGRQRTRTTPGSRGPNAYEEDQGFAFLNSNISVFVSASRSAHELAHHIHKDTASSTLSRMSLVRQRPPAERRANTFAAEFLIPLQAVNAWMEARGAPPVDLRLVLELAASSE